MSEIDGKHVDHEALLFERLIRCKKGRIFSYFGAGSEIRRTALLMLRSSSERATTGEGEPNLSRPCSTERLANRMLHESAAYGLPAMLAKCAWLFWLTAWPWA